ncbi:uncharacterized protein LOC102712021 [Oryza brachyantha]|uniref:Uncharacterized protein n=1 Tax=Oryza brachyantha TaxID=4533 RepID=J3KY54_ORYBR|nr:uncharacterized protein LOC102712021 [Oryza brachyantha]
MSLTGRGEGTPALELLDECWFFSNTLGRNAGRDGGGGRPPMLPRSPSSTVSGGRPGKGQGGGKEGAEQPTGTSRFYASGCRRLLRTPSLPSPRVGMEMSKDEEVVEAAGGGGCQEADAEDDDLNWSSIYEGVLRTRIAEEGVRSALRRAPSMPITSSATGRDDGGRRGEAAAAATGSTTPGMSRLRHAHSTMERHCRSHTPTKADRTPRTSGGGGDRRQPPRRELRSFSSNQQPLVRHQSLLQDKRWESSSDLESIEVQGFRDLGFVFDQEELRERLADVLPGLRGKSKTPSGSGSASDVDNDDANTTAAAATGSDNGTVRRPYLSEAWYHVRRPAATAAALRLQQSDARSAAEMKDQIRMWAQAVACNVRQEC